MKKITVLLVILTVLGCATSASIETLTSSQRIKALNMRVYQEENIENYTIVGKVEGVSCSRNAKKPKNVTPEEATGIMKIKASELDADAIINSVCQYGNGLSWKYNCWEYVICVGDAVRFAK